MKRLSKMTWKYKFLSDKRIRNLPELAKNPQYSDSGGNSREKTTRSRDGSQAVGIYQKRIGGK